MKLKIEYISTEDLKTYANNAKIHTDEQIEQIKTSIREFGFNDPIAVWKNNEIIEGHGRLIAATELGMDQVPIIRLDGLSDEERRAYMLVHNNLTMNTGFDIDILNLELDDIVDINMEQFGFDIEIEEENPIEVVEDNYEPIDVESRCKTGDVWQLGNHRLICGDSTDVAVIDSLMDGAKADIAFTSPPYNVGKGATEAMEGKESKYNNNDDNKSAEDYIEFLNAYIHCAILNSQYVFMNIQSLANNKIALVDVLSANKNIYADTIIWDKGYSAPALAHNVLNSTFEYIHVFSEKANRNIGTIPFHGTIDNILHLPPQRHNEYSDIHNATFSVEFASWFITRFAKETVLDSFGGTGTTLIACEQLNRKCYMCELDEHYCDIILQRWETFTGKKAVLLND